MSKSCTVKKISCFLCPLVAAALISLAGTAMAAPVWTKVADEGITAASNTESLAGPTFKGRLAVGTSTGAAPARMYTTDGSQFTQVHTPGFGHLDNVENVPSVVYGGQVYIGTKNDSTGGELWKWPGSGNPVLVQGNGWGEGWASDAVIPFGVVGDKLVVTLNNTGGPPAGGIRIHEWDGHAWSLLVGPGASIQGGFGNANNRRVPRLCDTRPFKGKLIIPVENITDGLQVYAYDGTAFKLVGHPGPGYWAASMNTGITAISSIEGKLYMGVGDTFGLQPGELWSYDGSGWKLEASGGLGNANNTMVQPLIRGDEVYAGTRNNSNGCRAYKRTGTDFAPISNAGFGPGIDNTAVFLSSFNGRLLGFTANWTDGAQVWATPIPPSIDRLVPDSGPAGTTVTIEGHDFGTTRGSGSVSLNGQVTRGIVSWSDTAIKVVVPSGVSTGLVVVTTANGDSNPVVFSLTLSKTWYFAEGTTRNNAVDGTYEEWICIQNPGDVSARVSLKYMLADGSNRTQKVTVKPTSRTTVSVNGFIGPDKDVSTLVESDQLVLAERPMYFNYHGKWTGGHDVIGVPTPRSDYYFAEGTTRSNAVDGSFEEWLSLMNPGDDDAMVQVAYQLGTGTVIRRSYPVPAGSRRTVSVNAEVGPDQDVSAVVHSGTPIVAERPMYFNYHDKWTGGHDVVGAPGTDVTFYFAEGTTRNNARDGSFEEWLCLQNPGQDDSEVTITYFTSAGDSRTQKVEVPADTRVTVDVGLKLGPDVDSSVMLESSGPILAERPMYFNYHGAWDGGHDVMGCNSPAEEFYFAEGTTRAGFATWIAVLNPDTSDTQVTFDYMLGDGTTKEVSATVKAHQRYTRDVLADVGAEQDVSILVKGKVRVVAERPMYFNYHGWATGGHDTLGYGI